MPEKNVFTTATIEGLPAILFICPDCGGLSVFCPTWYRDEQEITTVFLLFNQKHFPDLMWGQQDYTQFLNTMVARGTLELRHGR